MHQSKLLAARPARWDNIKNQTELLLMTAKHVLLANMLRTQLEAQRQKAVKLVPTGSTKMRILLPPTVAQAAGQACILPPRVRLVRLALQGSTMIQVKQHRQLINAASVILVNMHKMIRSPGAQNAQQDTTKTKIQHHSTHAKNAKRDDTKIKHNKVIV